MFPALFPSNSMVFIDYTCITSVTEYSKSIRLLLNFFKVLYYGRSHYFQAHVTYVTLKIALNVQVNVSNKTCLYLIACWHRFMNFFLQGLPILSIHLINALSFNCYVCYQLIHKLFWVSV